MKKSLLQQAAEINRKNRKRRTWHRIVSMLCCISVFCTTYSLILPAISLETGKSASVLSESDGDLVSPASGAELVQTVSKVDGGDLSETVHWAVEDVTDAFGDKTRRVRIYGEGEMPDGSTPWKSIRGIVKVVVEDGITRICKYAFLNMTTITSAVLGNDVAIISEQAFKGCKNLSSVNIPDSMREIQSMAFGDLYDDGNSALSELKLNEGLETISGPIGGRNIQSLYIPKTVTSIAANAFENNTRLKELIIDDENPNYKTDDEHKSLITKDGKELIRLLNSVTGDYVIPDGVTTIKDGAINGIKGINGCQVSSIKIPDTVRNIGKDNFYKCVNITELNFPVLPSWTSGDLWKYKVRNCEKLTKVTFAGFDEDYDYKDFAFNTLFECPSLKEIVFPDYVYDKVTSLGQRAFSNTGVTDEFLKKFVKLQKLPNGGSYPPDNASFKSCSSLNQIVLGEDLTYIQDGAFDNCLNVKEIVLNSADLSTVGSSFKNLVSCRKLTVGNTVNKLNKSAMNAIFANNITDVAFEGPNVIEIESGIEAPAPFDSLGGTYYVDAQGALYKLEDGNASLVYFPVSYSSDSYNVPATITANDTDYNVTSVGSSAFKGAKLKTVTFAAASSIEVANAAFYNCENLESVNGKSAIAEVNDLFNSVGSAAFYGTKLTGDKGGNDKATKSTNMLTIADGTDGFKVQVVNSNGDGSDYDLYTGESQKITVSVSNPDNLGTGTVARLYLDIRGTNFTISSTVGTTEYGENGYPYTLYKSDVDGIYYYEFKRPEAGKTGGFSFNVQYNSPKSSGGTMQVWGRIFTQEEVDALGSGIVFADSGEYYHEYEWTTVERNLTVKESVSGTASLVGSGTGVKKANVKNLKFNISADNTATGRTGIDNGLAQDLIRSFSFTNTFTLPADFKFDEDIKAAIKAGNYFVSGRNVYASVSGENVPVLEFNADVKNLTIEYPDADEKQLIIKYDLLNGSTTTEISDYNFNMIFSKGVFYTDKDIVSGDSFDFTNKVEVVNNYSYSAQKTSDASVTATVTAGDPDLTLKKTDSAVGYLSEDQSYKISVSNESATTYPDFKYVTDTLPDYVYIPAESMQKMMLEEFGKRLTITIDNAEIADNSASIRKDAVTVDNQTGKVTNQNTGWNIPYNGCSAEGTDEGITKDTVKIYWEGSDLKVSCGGNVKTVDTADAESLADILDELGYFVTRSAKYTLKWDFSSDFVLYGGKAFDLNVYSKAMDTFMMLYFDREGTYQNEKETIAVNYAYALDGSENKLKSATTSSARDHRREIYLKHVISRNGAVLDADSSLVNNDVLDQSSMFKHYGNGTYGTLPLVDKLSSNQRLLVRADLNSGLSAFDTTTINGVDYYILKYNDADSHTLTNVYTNEGEMAAKVEISPSGTLIHWYFDDLPAGEYIKSVDYKTLVDVPDGSGAKWSISSETWLNDHQTHRLHVAGGIDGLSIDFDKKILTNPGEVEFEDVHDADKIAELNENQKLDTFSLVGEYDHVYYRLSLKAFDSAVTVNGSDIYDCLPWKYNWQKTSSVNIYYVYDNSKVTVDNEDHWDVTDTDPSTSSVSADYRFITWDSDFKVTLAANSELAMYVMLTFPNGSEWNELATANNGATLYNTFYLYGIRRDVSHELKLPVEARIQKGVYETGGVVRDYSENYKLPFYVRGNTRQYYMNQDARARFVTYYATVSNNGMSKLYLNDMQDILPRGFKFRTLLNCDTISLDVVKNLATENNGGTSPIADIDGVNFVNATVGASTSDRSENYQKITFKFSKADAISGISSLSYDETYGKYYLNPGEAIRFGYVCIIGEEADTDDIANNVLSLPVDNYLESEVLVKGKASVASDKNGLVENDGSCDVIDNDIAESLGCNGYDNNTKWYKSEVNLTRGEIVPEISKKASKIIKYEDNTVSDYAGYAFPTDTVLWNVVAENTGERSLTDYTITDTMELPYQFEGDFRYAIYENSSSTVATNHPYSSDSKGMPLFTIERNDDGTVRIYNNKNYQHAGDFDYGDVEYGRTYIQRCYVRNDTGNTIGDTESIPGVEVGEGIYKWEFSFKLDKDADGKETLSIRFINNLWSIPAGGRGELEVSVARKDKTDKTSGQYRNDVQLLPTQDCEYDRVVSSDRVKNEEGDKVIGVAANSFINVINAYGTTSVKSVTELNDDGTLTTNSTSSNDANNTITLKGPHSKFQYKSSVKMPKEVPTKMFVMIDTLPEVGDHAAFQPDDKRGSQFKVNFVDYTPVVEIVAADGTVETLTEGTDYTIDYSSKTVFDNDDWNGDSTWDGTVDPSTHRSIRLNVSKEIPKDATINLYYRAVAADPETVKDGEIAYSSFGYRYRVFASGETLAPQDAAPLKVGVRAPNIPYLAKQLSTRDGAEYIAETDETVKFVIYQGSSKELTGSSETEIADKLGTTPFTVVTLNVASGQSKSDSLMLDGLKQYKYVDGVFVETTTDWVWTPDTQYTVYEYEYSDSFLFKAYGKNNKPNYTFTYMPATTQHYTCENILKSWQLTVVKKDADDESVKLAGAVFGIYSTEASEQIDEGRLEKLVEKFGLSSVPSAIENTSIGGSEMTLYLVDIGVTDEFGVASWNGLVNEDYAVKELCAPDGYIINNEEDNLRFMCMPLDISLDSYTTVTSYTNKSTYNLPKTGGIGTVLFTLGGVSLIATSALFYVYNKRRRYVENTRR